MNVVIKILKIIQSIFYNDAHVYSNCERSYQFDDRTPRL